MLTTATKNMEQISARNDAGGLPPVLIASQNVL